MQVTPDAAPARSNPIGDAPLPHLTIPQLQYLLAVTDHPTWSDAAQTLGVSGSALSQGLTELQRRLGVTLFDRRGRTMHLRPEAAAVVGHARRVLAETRDLADWARLLQTGERGRVSIGMIDAAAIRWFGDTIAAFRAAQPDVELRLTVAPSGELVEELRAGRLDLAVAVQAAHTESFDFAVTALIEEPLHVFAPVGQERRRPQAWGPWVTFPERSHTRRLIEAAVRAAGASFEVIASSSQPEVLREMVRIGSGWTVLPEPIPGAREGREGVVRVRKTPIAKRTLSLFERPHRPRSAAELRLRDALVAASKAAG